MIDRQKVYNKYNGRCAYCGKEIEYKDMQVDHIIPIRNGGNDNLENLNPSCRRCNHYKRAASIESFRNAIEQIPVKLSRDYIYKVGMDYGFYNDSPRKVKFYFERVKGGAE